MNSPRIVTEAYDRKQDKHIAGFVMFAVLNHRWLLYRIRVNTLRGTWAGLPFSVIISTRAECVLWLLIKSLIMTAPKCFMTSHVVYAARCCINASVNRVIFGSTDCLALDGCQVIKSTNDDSLSVGPHGPNFGVNWITTQPHSFSNT